MHEGAIKVFRCWDLNDVKWVIVTYQDKSTQQRWRDVVRMRRSTRDTFSLHGMRNQFMPLQRIAEQMIHGDQGSDSARGTRTHSTSKRKVFDQLNLHTRILTECTQQGLHRHAGGVSISFHRQSAIIASDLRHPYTGFV